MTTSTCMTFCVFPPARFARRASFSINVNNSHNREYFLAGKVHLNQKGFLSIKKVPNIIY